MAMFGPNVKVKLTIPTPRNVSVMDDGTSQTWQMTCGRSWPMSYHSSWVPVHAAGRSGTELPAGQVSERPPWYSMQGLSMSLNVVGLAVPVFVHV